MRKVLNAPNNSGLIGTLISLAAIGLAYFALARGGLLVATLNKSASPFWPASGLAIASVYFFGWRGLGAIFSGAFLANASSLTQLAPAGFIAMGNSAEAILGAYVLRLVSSNRLSLDLQSQRLGFVLASLVAPLASATTGAITLASFGLVSSTDLISRIWLTWWVGDALGTLLVLPILMTLKQERPRLQWAWLLLLTCVCAALVGLSHELPFFLGSLPLALIAAIWLNSLSSRVLVFAIAITGVYFTFMGQGPFADASINQNLLHLQLYMAAISITSLASENLGRAKTLLLPATLLLSGWLVTGLLFVSLEKDAKQADLAEFQRRVDDAHVQIQSRLKAYEDALRGGASLFTASEHVSEKEWLLYFRSLNLHERYPGISLVGFVQPVKSAELSTYFERAQRNSAGSIQYRRIGEQRGFVKDHFILRYVEPLAENQNILGFDLGSEEQRRRAAEQARDTAQPTLSTKISLIHGPEQRSGFLMFLPIYRAGARLDSVEARRKGFLGWVDAAFYADEFFTEILKDTRHLSVKASLGENPAARALLFQSVEKEAPHSVHASTVAKVGAESIYFKWGRSPAFPSTRDATAAWVAFCGSIVSLLLSGLVASLLSTRRRAETLAAARTQELFESREQYKRLNSELEMRVADRTRRLEEMNHSLESSEQRFKTLANQMPQIVWTVGPDLATDYLNEQWWSYTGLDKNVYSRAQSMEVVHPEDRERLIERWKKTCATGAPFDCEYRIRRHDGSYRWFLGRLVFNRDESGNVTGGYGTTTDIEDWRQVLNNLQSSENRFRTIVSESPFPTVLCSPDGRVTQVNRAYKEMWNIDDEYVNEKVLKNYNLLEDPLLAQLGITKHAQEAFAGAKVTVSPALYDPALAGFSGRKRWVQAHFSSIRGADGEVSEVILMLNDVTESIEATELARFKHRELQAILDNSPAVIFIKDLDGRMTMVNRQFERSFGRARDDVIGKDDQQLWPAEIAQKLRANDLQVIRTGEAIREEEEVPQGNETRNYLSIKFPLRDDKGEICAVCGIATDITEQKKTAADKTELMVRERSALESSQLKSEFLANMSHEIRTPINGVVGMSALLLNTELNPEQRDFASMIKSSGENLLTIINDILDFSKIEANKLDLETMDFELTSLCEDTVKTLQFAAQQKGIKLQIQNSYTPGTAVRGDPGRIRQVLTNLINNAIKFTPQGNVTLRVTQSEGGKGRSSFRFEVQDTGIGIPQEALGRMFHAFSQADPTTSRRFGGTGLGLSICRRLVELMDGEIGLTSAEGQGSTFWFVLNLEVSHAEIRQPSDVPVPAFPARSKKIRILVAEDNTINQKIAVKQLEKLGFHADVAANGAEAIDALRNLPYDLVLMDCQMPEMDGFEASRVIRNSKTLSCNDIPIIAMTANALKGDRERCLEAGMDDYVAKPVRLEDLARVLERWISRSTELDKLAS